MHLQEMVSRMMKTDRTYTPLFDFQILFDTDFGLMSLIASDMQDIDVFDHNWIQAHHTNILMIKALYERTDKNPLIQTTVINDKTEIDELYESFINDSSYYEQILDRSMCTEIYNLLDRCIEFGDIYPYILYRNEAELNILKEDPVTRRIEEKNFINIKDLIMNPKNYANKFSQMYCKYRDDEVIDALVSLNSYAKTLYVADYPFNNFEGKPGTIDVSGEGLTIAMTICRCDIRSIDVYNRFMLKEEESNGDI